MAPRRRRSPLALDLASLIPWWVWLIFAALAYFLLHSLATVSTTTGTPAERMGKAVSIGIASAGQYLVPSLFILGALVAALRSRRRWHDISGDSSRFDSTREEVKLREPEGDLVESHEVVWGKASQRTSIDTTRWSKELLRALEWKRFEILCGAYFEALGFRAQVAREGADGGVDIHLYLQGADTPGMIVQCKAWKAYRVGVKPIRELLGVMTAAGVGEGIFVTTATFTNEAREFASGKNIHLIDGDDLIAKIAALSPGDQAALLRLATEGDFSTPTCASCGVKMVERVSKKSGETFWGCTNYPRCRFTLRFST